MKHERTFWSNSDFPSLWSASPTPFNYSLEVDDEAVGRMIEHHIRLGVDGVLLAGTCGEGPWMPVRERRRLVRFAREAAAGRLRIGIQVSDNSAARILENAAWAAEDGADMAAIAPPAFLMNASRESLLQHYRDAIRGCPLPVCIYEMGLKQVVRPPMEILPLIYGEPNVVMIKDSASEAERREVALEIRRKREDLRLFSGDEFRAATHMAGGYDGLLIGGAVFNGFLARQIMGAAIAGDAKRASELQERMNRMMYSVYGGESISCWLGGLKHLLVRMGIFSSSENLLHYGVTPDCAAAIEELLETEREILFPGLQGIDGDESVGSRHESPSCPTAVHGEVVPRDVGGGGR